MDSSILAAWWGAVTGTLALAWEIFRWHSSGPKLLVSAATDMQFARPGFGIDDELFILVNVRNVGDAATTITHFVGVTYKRWLGHLRRKRSGSFFITTGPESPVPHRLEPGATWSGMVKQAEAFQAANEKGNVLYLGVCHSMANKPQLARVPKAKAG